MRFGFNPRLQFAGERSIEHSMLSKCANPACSTTFRYLSEGKLYLIDSKADWVRHGTRAATHAGKSGIYEYFWLCSSCSRDMTIQIDHKFEVSVVHKPGIRQDSEPGMEMADAAKKISAG